MELELPDRLNGPSSTMEDPESHRSYDAVGWDSADPLKRTNRRFGGAPVDAVCLNGKTMAT